ncbi:hypothetical protein C0W65_12655 [Bacillus subtilis]|nr:hypothetical protein C0W65_12655 [Bacillus subtilis]
MTFQAKIESEYAGKTIINVATVNGSSIDNPDKPKAEMNVVSKGSETPSNSDPSGEPSKSTPEKTGEKTNAGKELPDTATNHYNILLVGFGLLLIGSALWYFRRKRNA